MHATVNRKALVTALARANVIVERRNTIPILSNVALDFGVGKLTLSATDLVIVTVEDIAADAVSEGAITASALDLFKIVKSGASSLVTLRVEDNRLIVDDRAKLPTLARGDYPAPVMTGDNPTAFTLPAASLALALNRVAFAISNEKTRYYLNGVFMHAAGDQLNFVATDGQRLAKQALTLPGKARLLPDAIIPRKTITVLRKLLAKTSGAVDLIVTPTTIAATVDGVRVQTKLIDGRFPDYTRVIPTNNGVRLTVNGPTMRAEVASVASIASSDGTRCVKVDLENMKLTVMSPESGFASAPLSGELCGKGFEVGFNHKYLDDVLAVFGKTDVAIDFDDAAAPVLLTARALPGFLSVIVPMRV